eukprot:TRINITY_DN2071_c0_g1_i1.p1 TRINITY_DN2071_c0_g1~~TRINITY_DN2071_c0_g1_i1.p1  ORF type:complete len:421 (+),score=57.85 TRINITY_DN2071_c0_g1_i1:135-1397(+)
MLSSRCVLRPGRHLCAGPPAISPQMPQLQTRMKHTAIHPAAKAAAAKIHDLEWLEVAEDDDLRERIPSDWVGQIGGRVAGSPLSKWWPKFNREAYTEEEKALLEESENPELRADGSKPVYWAPEYTAKNLSGIKHACRFEKMAPWDERSADVLPGLRKYSIWEREIIYGKRSAHHTNPWPDSRGSKQYKVHKFPSGDFLEICGNLVRLNYGPTAWVPNRQYYGTTKIPLIYEFPRFPSLYAWVRGGTFGRMKCLWRDFRELGPVAFYWKIHKLKYHWWAGHDKILVGIDAQGIKYWESPASVPEWRMRFCEYPYSENHATFDDIPPQWTPWLGGAAIGPPNEPENWPLHATEYYHSMGRWDASITSSRPSSRIAWHEAGQFRAGQHLLQWDGKAMWYPTNPNPVRPKPTTNAEIRFRWAT